MELKNGYPLCQVHNLKDPKDSCDGLLRVIVRLAEHGLIHGDLNEFNVLVDSQDKMTIIDFPQMVSTSHPNAEWYFDRDVECVCEFFLKKHSYKVNERPLLTGIRKKKSLDLDVRASGFTKDVEDSLMEDIHVRKTVDESDQSENESELCDNQVKKAEFKDPKGHVTTDDDDDLVDDDDDDPADDDDDDPAVDDDDDPAVDDPVVDDDPAVDDPVVDDDDPAVDDDDDPAVDGKTDSVLKTGVDRARVKERVKKEVLKKKKHIQRPRLRAKVEGTAKHGKRSAKKNRQFTAMSMDILL
jgi:RIO kinase 2